MPIWVGLETSAVTEVPRVRCRWPLHFSCVSCLQNCLWWLRGAWGGLWELGFWEWRQLLNLWEQDAGVTDSWVDWNKSTVKTLPGAEVLMYNLIVCAEYCYVPSCSKGFPRTNHLMTGVSDLLFPWGPQCLTNLPTSCTAGRWQSWDLNSSAWLQSLSLTVCCYFLFLGSRREDDKPPPFRDKIYSWGSL